MCVRIFRTVQSPQDRTWFLDHHGTRATATHGSRLPSIGERRRQQVDIVVRVVLRKPYPRG